MAQSPQRGQRDNGSAGHATRLVTEPLAKTPDILDGVGSGHIVAGGVGIGRVLFAKVQSVQLPSSVPTYKSVLILNDLTAAALLFGQFTVMWSRAIPMFTSGYLFMAVTVVGHLLSFPGLFAPGGLPSTGSQSTTWIYMFRYTGFPLFVIAHAVLKSREEHEFDRSPVHTLMRQTVLTTVGAVLSVSTVCVLSATVGGHLLLTIMAANRYTCTMGTTAGGTWYFYVAALAALWRSRLHLTLDAWLMVMLYVWTYDVALSAMFSGRWYDLESHAGRIFGLLGTSPVLLLLLIENAVLHSRLTAVRAELKRLAASHMGNGEW